MFHFMMQDMQRTLDGEDPERGERFRNASTDGEKLDIYDEMIEEKKRERQARIEQLADDLPEALELLRQQHEETMGDHIEIDAQGRVYRRVARKIHSQRWRLVHNLIAHPLLAIYRPWGERLHEWTAEKMYEPRPGSPGERTDND
jgi:predicted DCC family thiol-disulfide oxidoreductase YuxK